MAACLHQWSPWCAIGASSSRQSLVARLFRRKEGVDVVTIAAGDGITFPKKGQTVVVHYTATLEDGSKVDSSRDREVPFRFRVGHGEVIKGWDKGVAQMSLGQRAQIVCSPRLAYGSRGHPGIIPPNAVLVIDVELLKVE